MKKYFFKKHPILSISKKAFSLIEISIVMIVIGILIAAVMSGRDVIKSSDVKHFYQKFAGKWQTVATSYYDRMSVKFTISYSYIVIEMFKDTIDQNGSCITISF